MIFILSAGNNDGSPMYLEGRVCSSCPADMECSDKYPGLCSFDPSGREGEALTECDSEDCSPPTDCPIDSQDCSTPAPTPDSIPPADPNPPTDCPSDSQDCPQAQSLLELSLVADKLHKILLPGTRPASPHSDYCSISPDHTMCLSQVNTTYYKAAINWPSNLVEF
jgi:hypothetical protein